MKKAIALLFFWAAFSSNAQPTSTRLPSAQKESDWVDNRWARTDVGRFLASSLQLPGGMVAKNLSVKVGPEGKATVAFDTLTCQLRAGWVGGFLRFDPARFGLVRSPARDGELFFSFNALSKRTNATFKGFHLREERVVLEYLIDGVRIVESPWMETIQGAPHFTRDFEVAAGSISEMALLSADKIEKSGEGTFVVGNGNETSVLSVLGADVTLGVKNKELKLKIGPETRRFKIFISKKTSPLSPLAEKRVPEDLAGLLEPGPPHWPEIQTAGQVGADKGMFAVDTLTVPYDNPFRALMFLAGVDFTDEGVAYVCTIHGDVWRVSGIDQSLRTLHWHRFATGLFQPLGLKVRDGAVYVLGRDQITCLRDLNGDGEADFYENFCNSIETSTRGHDYVTSLDKDAAGNFYYVDPLGVHRISRDGSTNEILSTGFRNPNGMSVNAAGTIITVSPQQGEWTPSSAICETHPGGYYGYGGPKISAGRAAGFDPPLCWIPHSVDNSSGGQVWIPPDRWGALGGKILHLLWGGCGMALVLRDVVNDTPQAAIIPLKVRFLSGPNRGTFNPRDGHFYIAGSTGWQTSAVKDGALQRVRLTGTSLLPLSWHVTSNALSFTFSHPLRRATAEDPGSFSLSRWNYRYAAQYGSKDWSVAEPEREGHDVLQIKSAQLLADQKTVVLQVNDLRPAMQMQLEYNLDSSDGSPARDRIWFTVHRLGRAD